MTPDDLKDNLKTYHFHPLQYPPTSDGYHHQRQNRTSRETYTRSYVGVRDSLVFYATESIDQAQGHKPTIKWAIK